MNARATLLHEWAARLQAEVLRGRFGRSRQQIVVGLVSGPRVGGLDIWASDDPAGLKRALNDQDGLNLAQTVPWRYAEGQPTVFSHGKLIRVEVPWPPGQARDSIPLRSIQGPTARAVEGGWCAGSDENGRLVFPNFALEPHWLFAGQTGAGKSVAMTSAVGQMARAGGAELVLVDGKHGEGLGRFSRLGSLAGPIACAPEEARAALLWAVADMGMRYDAMRRMGREAWDRATRRLVVVIDEVQTVAQEPGCSAAVALLLQQGRAAKVNLMVSTQYPLNAQLGDPTMKQNLGGRVVFKLNSAEASRVAIGQAEPTATRLLGKGDAYVVGGGSFVRTQIAYMNGHELGRLPGGGPKMASWPEAEAAPIDGAAGGGHSAAAIALAILAAEAGAGRPTLKRVLDERGEGRMGMSRLYALVNLGKEVAALMRELREEVQWKG